LSPPQGHAWLFWRDSDGALSVRADTIEMLSSLDPVPLGAA
jgi:hypothetical protein